MNYIRSVLQPRAVSCGFSHFSSTKTPKYIPINLKKEPEIPKEEKKDLRELKIKEIKERQELRVKIATVFNSERGD